MLKPAGIDKITIGKHQTLLVGPHHPVGTNQMLVREKVQALLMLGVKQQLALGPRQRMEMTKGVGNNTI